MNTLGIHGLKGLSEDNCWLIIKAKALEKEIFHQNFNPWEKYYKKMSRFAIDARVVGDCYVVNQKMSA